MTEIVIIWTNLDTKFVMILTTDTDYVVCTEAKLFVGGLHTLTKSESEKERD